jgi:predicted nucleotidyltransferase
MISLVADNKDAIVALCRQYGVRRLALFGSAAKGTFDPGKSDLDFLVDLGEYEEGVARRYLGFVVALQETLGRDVDVVTSRSVKSSAFRDELAATAQTIYEAHDRTAVA